MKRWILIGLLAVLIGWYFDAGYYIQQHLRFVGAVFTTSTFAHSSDTGSPIFKVVSTPSTNSILYPRHEGVLTLADALSSVSRECISAVRKPFIETPFFDVFSWTERIYKYIGWEYTPQQYTGYDLVDMSVCDKGDPKNKYSYSFDLPLIGKVDVVVEDSITTSLFINHDPLSFSITRHDGAEVKEFIYDMRWSLPSTLSIGGIKCSSVALFSITSPIYKSLAIMNTTIQNMSISCQFQPFQNAANMLSEFSVKLGSMDYVLEARNIAEKHILNMLTWYHMNSLRTAIESYIQGKLVDAWVDSALSITSSINNTLEYSKSLIYSVLPSFTKMINV